jgi:hypothetical protein
MSDPPAPNPTLRYQPSPKHCEPITAAKHGTKCPNWSAADAQRLLDTSVAMGQKRVATARGLAFVAQCDPNGVWHGYPEGWDAIDRTIKDQWKRNGLVTGRQLKDWATTEDVRHAWKVLRE